MKVLSYGREVPVTAGTFGGAIYRFREDVLGEIHREKNVLFYEDSVKDALRPLDRAYAEVSRQAQNEIGSKYKKFRESSTVLNKDEIHEMCYIVTTTLGKLASQLAFEKGYNTEVDIATNRGDIKIDLEAFLRKIQNKAFDYFEKEFEYGKQPIPVQTS